MSDQTAVVLDLRGLKCPFPVLRARKAMQDLPSGAVIVAEATDPASRIDFPHFCNEGGHALLDYSERDGLHAFTIRKK